MFMKKTAACFIGAILLVTLAVEAQEAGEILLTTKPPGATIYLYGEFDLVATSPARLPSKISGLYKARIARPGYETWKGKLAFVPGGADNIEIKLSKKTRIKAALRSLFIPGWGQIYSGNQFRGGLFTASAAVSATAIFITDRRYDEKRSDLDIASAEYASAQSIEERERLRAIRDDIQRSAYKAETDRRTAIAIGATLWAFNVIDALIFFPEGDAFFPTVSSIGDGAFLTLTARF